MCVCVCVCMKVDIFVIICLLTLCHEQVKCQGPVHFYDPCNCNDSAASEYGGYTMAEFR